MIVELGLVYISYRFGRRMIKDLTSVDPAPVPEDDVNVEAEVIEEEVHIVTQEDLEKQQELYVGSTLASMGLFTLGKFVPVIGPAGFIPYIYGMVPYVKDVKNAIVRDRKVNADVLFFMADILTLYSGSFFTAAFGLYLIHAGKMAVLKAKDSSQQLVMHLFEELPQMVMVVNNGIEIETPLADIKKGDILAINAGEVIPVDGTITSGMASIDQHALTGESQPAEKGKGETVFANTIVLAGNIHIAVERSGFETTSYQVAEMLFNSVSFKSDIQLKGEEWADLMTLPMLGASIVALPFVGPVSTAVFINSHIGVRIRILAPMGTLKHISIVSQKGILVKDGRALEKLHLVDTVLFDKTGTLTTDEPEVINVVACTGYEENTVLGYAAAAERKQSHPIARAIIKKAVERNLELPEVHDSNYQIGYGISVQLGDEQIRVGSIRFLTEQGIPIPDEILAAQEEAHLKGNIFILVGIDDRIGGAIELQPTIHEGIRSLMRNLKDKGVKLGIVSGDHKVPTEKLADELGMDHFYHDILPQNKADIVEKLQDEGKTVCFIGDGINDSIALKKADVSISLSGATTIAKDMSEIIFMDGNISPLDELFEVSEQLDENLKSSLRICLMPSAINLAGAVFLNFDILTSLLVNVGFNLYGMRNVMPPKKSAGEKERKKHKKADVVQIQNVSIEAQSSPEPVIHNDNIVYIEDKSDINTILIP